MPIRPRNHQSSLPLSTHLYIYIILTDQPPAFATPLHCSQYLQAALQANFARKQKAPRTSATRAAGQKALVYVLCLPAASAAESRSYKRTASARAGAKIAPLEWTYTRRSYLDSFTLLFAREILVCMRVYPEYNFLRFFFFD